ncbi:hypothetical protein NPX13_g1192 [Xylaria arbuscula]|uniref:Mitochondrial division protein 1 n=1 Tax=Xylaria arbuscula TaxID=114810 RepID=A0A9W8NLI0_9PEZI|nr:hypothetical protein NPX13_g1192 [Xylaria arbuscula]
MSRASCASEPVENLPAPNLTQPFEQSKPKVSLSEGLWNTAYDNLEDKEKDLVSSYVRVLLQVLQGEGDGPPSAISLAVMKDPVMRQEVMRQLVRKGQERISSVYKITTKMSDAAGLVLSVRGLVDLTLQSVPQAAPAALPWAGVCIGLQILQNPGQVTKSNIEGMTYVISRMDWYCALTTLLLDKRDIAGDSNSQPTLFQLKRNIVNLYQALLLFQMKSVCSYYRNQGVRFLRDVVRLDDWESAIISIREIEATLGSDIEQYSQGHIKSYLAEARSERQSTDKASWSREAIESACRRDLRVVDPEDDMQRIEGNKDKLLDDAYQWIFETNEYTQFTSWESDKVESRQRQVLWLKGQAGTGKTMLMIGIIRHILKQSAMLSPGLSFFFCQATDIKLNNGTAILRSLIWLLLLQQPCLMSHLLQKYKDSGPRLFNDSNSFYALSAVFENMISDPQLSPIYFVVDALDECLEGRAGLLELILRTLSRQSKVKWLLSSRPEVDLLLKLKSSNAMIELDPQRIGFPVRAYIKHKLKVLGGKKGYNDEILGKVSRIVTERAEDTFLWVALAFKALGERHGEYAVGLISQLPPGLLDLYHHMMLRIEERDEVEPQDCKKLLKTIFLAFRPLRLSELSLLTDLSPSLTNSALEACGSFVTVSADIVNLIHKSAKDYLEMNYTVELDPTGKAQGHMNIVGYSLNAIASLKRNVYGLELGSRSTEIKPPDPDPLASLQYSCISWIDHLCFLDKDATQFLKAMEVQIWKFLKEAFFRWLESLSLFGRIEHGVLSIKKLVHFVHSQPDSDSWLFELLRDADRFLTINRAIIEQVPLQIYGSALTFSPTTSQIRNQYWEERMPLVEVLLGAEDHWGAYQQLLEGHTDHVSSIAYSSDGKVLASGSRDKTVRLWNPVTGALQQLIRAQDSVNAIAFSADNKILVLGLSDSTIRLWDLEAVECQQTLKGHTRKVTSIAISCGGRLLASASYDSTVRLWDMETAVCQRAMEGHTEVVNSVAFSYNGRLVASASSDKTIRLWDVSTVTFSPNGRIIASGSEDRDISIWDAATGTRMNTLREDRWIIAVVFSPNSETLASATTGDDIGLWDISTTTPKKTSLRGHRRYVEALQFSPDGKTLVSASSDSTIMLWDMKNLVLSNKQNRESPGFISALTLSPNNNVVASLNFPAGTVGAWDLSTNPPSSKTLKLQRETITALGFLADGKILQTYSKKGKAWNWDAVNNIDKLFEVDSMLENQSSNHLTSYRADPYIYPDPKAYLRTFDKCQSGHRVSEDHCWITLDGKDLLWLPVNFRPKYTKILADAGSTVPFLAAQNRVVVLKFLD